MPHELSALETIFANDDHAFVLAMPLIVQVRRGEMTQDALGMFERSLRDLKGRSPFRGGPVGFTAVLEEGAGVASGEVRARQRVIFESLAAGLDVRVAIVVSGDGVSSMLQRTVTRGLMFADRRMRVVGSLEEAASFLAPHLGARAAEVVSVIQKARAVR